MPELPEVETTRRGIAPHIEQQTITGIIIRQGQLRWPVPPDLAAVLSGQTIIDVNRRGKYLLLGTSKGTVIIHLGMSGSLRIVETSAATQKHDHVDFIFENGTLLRFNDPRRFGAILWHAGKPQDHPLLASLGPEPLSDAFDGAHLYAQAQKRKSAVKSFIMDGHVVVGVGNIYANEALFMAGIHPARQAGRISVLRYQKLSSAIKQVLQRAIDMGGTTLRDFVNAQGKPGYFQQTLLTYGRTGEPCPSCAQPIQHIKISQRASFFCCNCQR